MLLQDKLILVSKFYIGFLILIKIKKSLDIYMAGKGFFENIFNELSKIFDPTKSEFVKRDPKSVEKLQKLNTELGQLHYVIRQKQLLLHNALMAPVGVMVGGELIQVGGEETSDLAYVAPDRPVTKIYSTARIIANILKKYETELEASLPKPLLDELQNLLINVHQTETDMFKIVFQMDELQNALQDGLIDDASVDKLKDLVLKARKKHQEQKEETDKLLKKISGGLVMIGSPVSM